MSQKVIDEYKGVATLHLVEALQTLHLANVVIGELDLHPVTKDPEADKAINDAIKAVMNAHQVVAQL